MPRTAPTTPITAALLALLVGGAHAQSTAQPDQAAKHDDRHSAAEVVDAAEDPGVRFNFHASTTYYDEADFDDNNGSIEAWRNSVGVGATFRTDAGEFNLGFDAEFTDYDFTIATGTPNTFDDTSILTFSASFSAPLKHGNAWFIGGRVSAAREDGAEFDDSITGTLFGGYRHKFSDRLELGLGVAISTRLEDDTLVIPLPQVRYDMGNGWVLSSQRAGLKLMYAANDALSLGVSGEYDARSFRLDTTNLVSAGAASESRIPVAFQVEYKPSKAVMLSGRVGAAFGSEIEFFNAAGNSINTREFDSSLFFSFGGTVFF